MNGPNAEPCGTPRKEYSNGKVFNNFPRESGRCEDLTQEDEYTKLPKKPRRTGQEKKWILSFLNEIET